MDPHTADHYRRAHTDATKKGADMPDWMLRRHVTHAIRLASTSPYRAALTIHEGAWGSADGFADELLRRRAHQATPKTPPPP